MATAPSPSTDAPEHPDAPCPPPPTNTRRALMVAAALVLAAAAAGPVVASRWMSHSGRAAVAGAVAPVDSAAASVPGAQRVVLDVSGMFCTSCERTVTAMLVRTPGVVRAEVSVARREAIILYDPARTTPAALVAVVKALGYRAAVRPA